MNKIIKGKTHYYENDTLTTGTFKIGETITFPNAITTTYSLSRVYDTEEIKNIIKENTKLKQEKQELKRIVDALEMAKQNMPKGTKFVIVAEEDYLRNIGIINERNKLGE